MPHTTRCRTGSSTREDDLVDAALSIAVTLVFAAFDLVSADGAMTLFASLGIEPGVSIPRGKFLKTSTASLPAHLKTSALAESGLNISGR